MILLLLLLYTGSNFIKIISADGQPYFYKMKSPIKTKLLIVKINKKLEDCNYSKKKNIKSFYISLKGTNIKYKDSIKLYNFQFGSERIKDEYIFFTNHKIYSLIGNKESVLFNFNNPQIGDSTYVRRIGLIHAHTMIFNKKIYDNRLMDTLYYYSLKQYLSPNSPIRVLSHPLPEFTRIVIGKKYGFIEISYFYDNKCYEVTNVFIKSANFIKER